MQKLRDGSKRRKLAILSPNITTISEDALSVTFSFLPYYALVKCSEVCHLFFKVISSNPYCWAQLHNSFITFNFDNIFTWQHFIAPCLSFNSQMFSDSSDDDDDDDDDDNNDYDDDYSRHEKERCNTQVQPFLKKLKEFPHLKHVEVYSSVLYNLKHLEITTAVFLKVTHHLQGIYIVFEESNKFDFQHFSDIVPQCKNLRTFSYELPSNFEQDYSNTISLHYLKNLSTLQQLKTQCFTNPDILPTLTSLKKLEIEETRLEKSFTQAIKQVTSLEHLIFNKCSFSDSILFQELKQVKQLKQLHLLKCSVSSDCVINLVMSFNSLEKLQDLSLSLANRVNFISIFKNLPKSLTRLHYYSSSDCPWMK